MRIILVRHAESANNSLGKDDKKKRSLDPELTEEGIEKSKTFGKLLKENFEIKSCNNFY
jgi:broad specificity phosphatase PhoE